MSKTKTRDEIITLLREGKLHSGQIGKMCGVHPAYVRAVKQRYITAPAREKLRAHLRASSDEYREMRRKEHIKLMRDPVRLAEVRAQKRKSWWRNRDHYNAKARDRYWQRKVNGEVNA